ncbi:discoidin domain-containing protein [Streptomyces sp. SID13031]|uniref:discoidin domain-containing protein n=1 Tax=Streptomyces sp. SID13031 TaxID=2706046 RepID=UPI0013CAD2D2|nr:discoidin domain-containing protein [Streptomyces sp. SID13031]NEA30997.1 carbohydrate-binding protein [Streptomyces sp. SID13031]
MPNVPRRLLAVLAGLLVPSALLAAPAEATGPTTLYVAPAAHAKGGTGTLARPLSSLEQARDQVRKLTKHQRGDIRVVLLPGDYRRTDTFQLTSQDSGRNGHKVIYQALPGTSVTIDGGRLVTGWTLSDPAKNIYKAHVGSIDFRQFYVNGERQQRARGPENPPGWSKTTTGYTDTTSSLANFKNQGDIEVDSRWGWMHYRCPVQSAVGTTVTMQQPCYYNANLHEGQEIQNPTWIENAYELLDSPGEWYLDKSTGDVYYLPKPGQSPTTATVVVPQVQSLVDVTGSITDPVQNIQFDGITFSYSTWLAPSSDDGMVEGQAGFRINGSGWRDFDHSRLYWEKTPGAVNVGYSRNISFTGNTFTHLGAVGLNLNTGSQGTTIRGNIVRDVAATGIQVGGTDIIDHHPADARAITKDTLVSNNVITKAAADYSGSLAIMAGYTEHTVIEHNKIYDLPYSGISVGWGWGNTDVGGDTNYPGNFGIPIYDTPTTAKNNIIRDNSISDIMKHQADGGAIYTLSMQPGSVVSGNYIKNTPGPAYGAIYHDEGSRYFTTTGNAFCNVDALWLFLNHGMNIDAQRNFTSQPRSATQANSTDSTIANNTVIPGCEQIPASIVNNAGLEPAYRYLDPQPAPADRVAPTKPGTPVVKPGFPTIADLTWPASTDAVGVTGYSVYANGQLVSASKEPSARITGLVSGRSYTFAVTARDAVGNESGKSQAVTATMPVGTDLALGKNVTVSSYSEPNVPASAVDGKLSTRWAQGLGLPDPSWLQVDLGAQYDLTGVITTFELSNGYRYKLEVSPDGDDWTMFEDHTSTATTQSDNYAAAQVRGRYLRLTIVGSNFNGGSIYEIEAYGKPATITDDHQPPAVLPKPTADVLLPTTIDLSWPTGTDNVGVTSYVVYQDGQRIATTPLNQLRVDGLAAGSTHSYTVVARDVNLNASPVSPATTVTTPAEAGIAVGKPVTVSSYSEPNLPALAVDGDLKTRWAQGLGLPDPSWLQVDLGTPTAVKSIITNFELPSGYKYKLEYSLDATTWSVFEDHTAVATSVRRNPSIRTAAVSARYVRLTVTGSNFNGGSIYELQIYGGF